MELAQALVSPGPKDGAAGIDGDAVGKEAVEALAEAVRLGADRRVLARMPQLAPLRSREDFRAWFPDRFRGKTEVDTPGGRGHTLATRRGRELEATDGPPSLS